MNNSKFMPQNRSVVWQSVSSFHPESMPWPTHWNPVAIVDSVNLDEVFGLAQHDDKSEEEEKRVLWLGSGHSLSYGDMVVVSTRSVYRLSPDNEGKRNSDWVLVEETRPTFATYPKRDGS